MRNTTSNYFPRSSTTVAESEEYVTVTYFIDSPKDVLNVQWKLSYDPACLKFDKSVNMNEADALNLMPMVDNLVWNVSADDGCIKANATTLNLYKFANKGFVPFVTVTFKVIGSGETAVNLDVEYLTLSSGFLEQNQEEYVIDNGAVSTLPTKTAQTKLSLMTQ